MAVKVKYLGTGIIDGRFLELRGIDTIYERIAYSYPDRMPRYCHPGYCGGKHDGELVRAWQWEPDGHAPGQYGPLDDGLPPVLRAPADELDRLGREVTQAIDIIHASPDQYPEASDYLESCRRYGGLLSQIDKSYDQIASRAAQPEMELNAAREVIGARRVCSRDEMAEILRRCQLVSDQGIGVGGWVAMCRDSTMVSITAGCIRHDQPGTIVHRPTILFAGKGCRARPDIAERVVYVG